MHLLYIYYMHLCKKNKQTNKWNIDFLLPLFRFFFFFFSSVTLCASTALFLNPWPISVSPAGRGASAGTIMPFALAAGQEVRV